MDDDLDPAAEPLAHTAVFESGIHIRQVTFGCGYSQVDHAAALEGRFPQHIVACAVAFVLQSPVKGRARDLEGLDHLHPDRRRQ